jgi:serine/threonine protein kinase
LPRISAIEAAAIATYTQRQSGAEVLHPCFQSRRAVESASFMSSPDKSDSAPPPSQLAGYTLLEKLGEGGMGVVYRANQKSLERIVALKLLTPKHAGNTTYRANFIREARAAARLHHPNLVSVFDAGESDGHFYYAMEFVQGETLLHWVQREGALPETLVIEIALCVANALKYAWEREQLIHRDVKPENIMVDRDGNVKLCDLGLAKFFGERGAGDGLSFGTPHYMSPEQARSDTDVDLRSDIYSLGLTMYHALTAQIPFHGGVPSLVMAKHLTEQIPDVRAHAPAASVHIVRILQRMLAKQPDDRYQTWEEVIRDLELARANKPPLCPLIFNGVSTMKRELVAPASTAPTSPPRPVAAPAATTFDVSPPPPPPVPRAKTPPPPPPPAPVEPHQPATAPPPRKRSAATVFLISAAVLFLIGVAGVVGWGIFQSSVINKETDKTIAPKLGADGKPMLPSNKSAAEALARAEEFARAFPAHFAHILPRYQAVAEKFPNTAEAARAEQLLAETRAAQAAAQNPPAGTQSEEEQFQQTRALAEFADAFLAAARRRDYMSAEETARAALDRPDLAQHRGVVQTAQQGAGVLRKFWDGLPRQLDRLRDQQLTLQGVTGVVVEVTSTEIRLDASGMPRALAPRPRSFPLAQIPYADLFHILEHVHHVSDRDAMLGVAWFSFVEGNTPDSERYLKAAERAGEDILPAQLTMHALGAARDIHDAHRLLRDLRAAFAEKNFEKTRAHYNELTTAHANSDLVRRARAELDLISEWITAEIARRIEQEKREQEERERLAAERAAQEERRARAAQAFAEFTKDFRAALSEREFARAQRTVDAAAQNPNLESERDTLQPIADAAQRVETAWKRLPDTFKALVGRQISVAGVTGKVAEISNGEIVIEVREGVSAGIAIADLGEDNSLALAALATRPNHTEGMLDLAWMYFAAGRLNAALARLDLAERTGANVESARKLMLKLSEQRAENP